MTNQKHIILFGIKSMVTSKKKKKKKKIDSQAADSK